MTIHDTVFKRGEVTDYFPALTTRRDEAYCEYIRDARNILMHAQQAPIGAYSLKILEEAGLSVKPDPESTEKATEFLMKDRTLQTYYRVKRSLQECFWTCILESFRAREDDLMAALDEADKEGPGTLEYDSDWKIPEYTKVDIHIQPGGFGREQLGGYIYDHGLKVFFGGTADDGGLHKHLASVAGAPKDGKIKRILDIGCSAGGTTTALKKLYPDAEVWGIDVGVPMVRYAHLRAADQGLDVNFKQMLAEDMDFPDDHFDLVTATLLFHELPIPASKRVISEVFRVVRPGGAYTIFDFSGSKSRNAYGMFFSEMDAIDNGEPYLPEYVRSNVEEIMAETGFEMEPYDGTQSLTKGRVGIKPTK